MKHKFLAALALIAVIFSTASHAEETNKWRFDASLSLFLAGLSGDVTAKGIPTHVSASFGDILENLEAGFAGRATVGYERWLFSTEFSYLRLGASTSAADLELEQLFVEPTLGYEVCNYAQVFAGARYNNISGDIEFNGPAGRQSTGTQDWWDPIIGTQLSFPLIKDKLSLNGRFDVGGFGINSHITWQVFPYLNWQFAKWGSAQVGYRWLATDYETGSGANKFRYDVIAQGPQLGLTFHF